MSEIFKSQNLTRQQQFIIISFSETPHWSNVGEAGDGESRLGRVTSAKNRIHPSCFLHRRNTTIKERLFLICMRIYLLLTSSFWHLFCRLWSASYSCRLPCWLQGVKEEEIRNTARNKEKDSCREIWITSRSRWLTLAPSIGRIPVFFYVLIGKK